MYALLGQPVTQPEALLYGKSRIQQVILGAWRPYGKHRTASQLFIHALTAPAIFGTGGTVRHALPHSICGARQYAFGAAVLGRLPGRSGSLRVRSAGPGLAAGRTGRHGRARP
jgi:hypothetical protein